MLRTQQWLRNAAWRLEGTPLCVLSYATRNWGDAANSPIVQWLAGTTRVTIVDLQDQYALAKRVHAGPFYMVVGSILHLADEATVVWGSGFLWKESQLKAKPRRVCAVRGPLSRQRLLDMGIDCPEVYGDPALIYPHIYRPNIRSEKGKIAVIPHYIDVESQVVAHLRRRDDVMIVDIKGGIHRVIDKICACEVVISSSLHGLILADAYHKPRAWIHITDGPAGDGFKFMDHLMLMGESNGTPFRCESVEDVLYAARHARFALRHPDLTPLIEECPFRRISERCNRNG